MFGDCFGGILNYQATGQLTSHRSFSGAHWAHSAKGIVLSWFFSQSRTPAAAFQKPSKPGTMALEVVVRLVSRYVKLHKIWTCFAELSKPPRTTKVTWNDLTLSSVEGGNGKVFQRLTLCQHTIRPGGVVPGAGDLGETMRWEDSHGCRLTSFFVFHSTVQMTPHKRHINHPHHMKHTLEQIQ